MAYPFESSIHLTNAACKLLFASETSYIEENPSGEINIFTNSVNVMTLKSSGMALTTGAFVDTIETTLTNDDAHLPTSGAVYDAIDALNTVTVANQGDNRVITATGTADALNAEGNLTFTSNVLKVGTSTDFTTMETGRISLNYGAGSPGFWRFVLVGGNLMRLDQDDNSGYTSFTSPLYINATSSYILTQWNFVINTGKILYLDGWSGDSRIWDDTTDLTFRDAQNTGGLTLTQLAAGSGTSNVSVGNQANNRVVTATAVNDVLNGESALQFNGTDLSLNSGNKIYLDNYNDTYIVESAANTISFFTNDIDRFRVTSTGVHVLIPATSNTESAFVIKQTTDDTYGGRMTWIKKRVTVTTATDGDTIGEVMGLFDNDAATPQTLQGGRLELIVDDASDGTEDTHWSFYQRVAGVYVEYKLGTDFGGGGVSWGTATNNYVVYGSASGAIQSDTSFTYDGSGNVTAYSSFIANLNGLNANRASYEYGRVQMYLSSVKRVDLDPGAANGASAVAYNLDTTNSISTAGSKLLRVATLSSERFVIYGGGAILLGTYGSGTHTGTAAYDLAVDSSGNVIEVATGGGSSYWSRSGTTVQPLTSGDDIFLAGVSTQIQFTATNTHISGGPSGGQLLFTVSGGAQLNMTGSAWTIYNKMNPNLTDTHDIGYTTGWWKDVYAQRYYLDEVGTYVYSNSGVLTFVDGTTGSKTLAELAGGSGISWSGSTTNGIATYGNASTANVEAYLTFSGSTTSTLSIDTSGAAYPVYFEHTSVSGQLKIGQYTTTYITMTSAYIHSYNSFYLGSATITSAIPTYPDYMHQISQIGSGEFPAYVLYGRGTGGQTLGEIIFCSYDSTEASKRAAIIRVSRGTDVDAGTMQFYTANNSATFQKMELNYLGHLAINGTAGTAVDRSLVIHRDTGQISVEAGRYTTITYGASGTLSGTEGIVIRPSSYQTLDYTNLYTYSNLYGGVQFRRGTSLTDLRVAYTSMSYYIGSTTTATLRHTWTSTGYSFYGSSSATVTIDGNTSYATIYLQANTGYDSRIMFRENASTRFWMGYDVSQTAFQIHSSTGPGSLASGDFSAKFTPELSMESTIGSIDIDATFLCFCDFSASAVVETESFTDGIDAARRNRLNPDAEQRIPWVAQCLEGFEGPVVAATDYVRAFAEQIRPYLPQSNYTVLGTDGFGRSDTRENLRRFFEVDRNNVVYTALHALHKQGDLSVDDLLRARKKLGLDPDKSNPIKS